MNTNPPPPIATTPQKPQPERTEHFELAVVSKVLIALTALFILGFIYLNARFMGATAEQIPFYIGMAVGALLFGIGIPMLLGWIVWRVTGRRKSGGNLVLCVLLVLVMLGYVANLVPCERVDEENSTPGMYNTSQE
jgi:hypothetical protein